MPQVRILPNVRQREKIFPLSELVGILREQRECGKCVVLCHGVFDLLHPGHIRHLESAKREGDILVVTVTPDRYVDKGPGRPVFSEQLRLESLAALASVDYVALNSWPRASETIHLLRPSVYVKGSEYEKPEDDPTGGILEEEAAIREVGGHILFTHEITFSSSTILNSRSDVLPPAVREFLAEFRKRHGAMDIIQQLRTLRNMKVIVIGDAIIDEYHHCAVLGRPAKAACLNARFLEAELFLGGALAVANHIAGFCGEVHLVSVLGEENPHLSFIQEHLRPNIIPKFFIASDRPTTVKRRFVEPFKYQKMFQVTFVGDHPLSPDVQRPLSDYFGDLLPSLDLTVVADFGHGMLTGNLIPLLAERSRFFALSAQTNSTNMGFNSVRKYPRADYVCLDDEELHVAYHNRFHATEHLLSTALTDFSARAISVTRGQHGSVTARNDGTVVTMPAFSAGGVDTLGAGDAYFAITAPCVAAGLEPDVVGFVGNAAGALAIHILGNKEFIESGSLFSYIRTLLK